MSIIDKMNPFSFTTSAYLIGIALCFDLNIYEQDSLGNWFQLVGQTLETYSAQISTIEAKNNNQNSSSLSYDTISNALKKMQTEIEKLKKED